MGYQTLANKQLLLYRRFLGGDNRRHHLFRKVSLELLRCKIFWYTNVTTYLFTFSGTCEIQSIQLALSRPRIRSNCGQYNSLKVPLKMLFDVF